MKLEVGMYVRTKRDGIGKIISLSIGEEDECCFIELSKRRTGIKEHNILKASHNIIDLIEAGDYVNGSEVMEADWINEDGEYEEGLAFPMYASDDLEVIENWQPLKYMKIKSIVTKEQFSQIEYKVVE